MSEPGWLQADTPAAHWPLHAGGDWRVAHSGALHSQIQRLLASAPRGMPAVLDLSAIEQLDTSGALLLCRLREQLEERGLRVSLSGTHEAHQQLIDNIATQLGESCHEKPARNAFLAVIEHLGSASCELRQIAAGFTAFLGHAAQVFARGLLRPSQWRITSLVHHVEKVGLNALPITLLIAFLIGIVVAYQGSVQLSRFGAQIFVVDGLALSILRELAVLLTAVVVAGRSGSAFTAEIGAMVVNEEVDALRTFGLDPMQILVLPRVLALTISLPLLAFLADLAGLFGGGLVCWLALGIGPGLFFERIADAVDFWDLFVGLSKTPVFAVLIALIGCHNGLSVSRSAESVGRLTTRAVVQAIFMVIVCDALFSIFFNAIGV